MDEVAPVVLTFVNSAVYSVTSHSHAYKNICVRTSEIFELVCVRKRCEKSWKNLLLFRVPQLSSLATIGPIAPHKTLPWRPMYTSIHEPN